MRLGTLAHDGATAAVVLREGGAAVVGGYPDVGALLRAGATGLDDARAALARGTRPLDGHILRRPVLDPGAVVCVGLNYRAHIAEMGRELPDHPTLFAKVTRALADPGADVSLPNASRQVDYEGELVIVVGRRVRDATLEEARQAIAGYTLMNDVSMRDFQYRTLQWFAGKNFEGCSPVGPWIVTADEVGGLDERELHVTVNGEERQRARLDDLVFGPAELVAEVSRLFTLEPGDLIATGTPGGVGFGMEPKRFLAPGDVVEVTVDGIGTLRNRFVPD